jgi:hypothetical protein
VTGQTSVSFDWRGSGAADTLRYRGRRAARRGSWWEGAHALPDSSPGPFWEADHRAREDASRFYRIGSGRSAAPHAAAPRQLGILVRRGGGHRQQSPLEDRCGHAADVAATIPTFRRRPARFVLAPGDLTAATEAVADVVSASTT